VRKRSALVVFGLLFLMAACGGDRSPEPNWTAADMLGDWQLVSGQAGGHDLLVPPEQPITLTFDGSQMSGLAPCNSYSGEVNVVGQRLTVRDIFQTLRGCVGVLETAERDYISALRSVTGFTVDGSALVLGGPQVLLRFQRIEDTS
jgi:heat shock protein HslJ